jgi:hypothetical protein
MRCMLPDSLIRFFDLSRILVLSRTIGCCTVSELLSFQALDGCSKCIQANSQDVECLIRRCRWTIDLSAQKPDTEKLPLMCAQFPRKTESPVVFFSHSFVRIAAEADARIAIAAAPTNYAAFKALAVALGKKSRFARHSFC